MRNHILRLEYLLALYAIASGSLLRHRLRSFLSILGVICGVAAVFATLSIGEGAKREVLAGIRQLGLENIIVRRSQFLNTKTTGVESARNYSNGLQLRDVQLLQGASSAITDVAFLKELQVEFTGMTQEMMPQVVACSSSYFTIHGLTVTRGRMILERDVRLKKKICLLGEGVARGLGSKGTVGNSLRVGEQVFLIVGIVRSAPLKNQESKGGTTLAREVDQMVFLPFGAHDYMKGSQGTGAVAVLDEIVIKLRSGKVAEQIVPLILRTLRLSHNSVRDFQLIVPWQLMYQAKKTQKIFNMVLGTIGAISLLVGGIGIMNVLLAVISERTREIGIRRAVGATRKDIMAQFLAESLLLTVTGGIIGIFAGLACSMLIARFAGWSVAVSLVTVVVPLITSVIVGICAGVYPAVKAAGMDPVQALRSA